MTGRGLVAVATVTAAAGVMGIAVSAAAGADAAHALAAHARADLAARVVQTGDRNYAGPKCPGSGWTCTTARAVLQVGAINVSECTPGAIEGPGQRCEIEQVGPGDNTAVCILRTEKVPKAFQLCRIKQTTTTGTNLATVRMVIAQDEGSIQIGEQRAHVDQTNESGDNRVRIRQRIEQNTTTGTLQAQDGRQVADADQINETGINLSNIRQTLLEQATASGSAAIAQCQNGDPSQTANPACAEAPSSDFDSEARVDQRGGTGKNHSRLRQLNRLRADADGGSNVEQTQGASLTGDDAGISGDVIQVAPAGLNFSAADQEKAYIAFANTPGSVTQQQYDGMNCCADQTGPGTASIEQRSTVRSTPGGEQLVRIDATCSSPLGECTTHSVGSDNVDRAEAACQATSCVEFVECSNLPGARGLSSAERPLARLQQDTCTSSDEGG